MITKTNRLLIIVAAVAVFSILLPVNADAQTAKPWIKNRWNIKAGISKYKSGTILKPQGRIVDLNSSYDVYQLDGRMEVNYGFLNCMEAGVYGGYLLKKEVLVQEV